MVVGDLATTVDVLVLGAGPAGYTAAIRAAQFGRQVALVDPGPPGASLSQNQVALPALLAAADQYQQISWLEQVGIKLDRPSGLDWRYLLAWKQRLIERHLSQIKHQLDQAQVELVRGRGWFLASNEVRIEGEYGARRYLFDQAVIAVGAEPAPWPGLPFDGQRAFTPAQALAWPQLPSAVRIIGADYLAAELATLWAKLGVAVSLLLPPERRLLPEFEAVASQEVRAGLERLGVTLQNLTGLENLAELAGNEKFVVSVGLTPHTGELHLAQAGVATAAGGFIQVNDRQQSSNPAIYAAGTITGAPPLAPVAIKQGHVVAANIAGRSAQFAPQAIPQVAWTDPPVAAVGLSLAEAEAAGYKVVVERSNVQAANDREGFVQVVAEQGSEILLGVLFVGPQAEAWISEATLALEMGATLTDLAETLHPFGGAGEALARAAEAATHIWRGA
jgi:dihydrolipoamide dehydrogenase